MTGLERRYRWLLRAYPRSYRHEHQEEMLGLLLEMAVPGQRRPAFRDAVDLLRGGVRIRLRRLAGVFGPRWADALAVAAVIAAVSQAALSVTGTLAIVLTGSWAHFQSGLAVLTAVVPLIAVVAAAGAVIGRPMVAASFAWLYAAVVVLGLDPAVSVYGVSAPLVLQPSPSLWQAAPVASTIVTAVALTAPPGPRRGVELLPSKLLAGWMASAIAAIALYSNATATSALRLPAPHHLTTPQSPTGLGPLNSTWLASSLLIAVLAAAAGRAMRSPVGCRAVLLLVIPIAAQLEFLASVDYTDIDPRLIGLVTILLPAGAFGIAALRPLAARASPGGNPHPRSSERA